MSQYDTKQALITNLVSAGIVPAADIAFENNKFVPAGKDLWLAAYFIPTSSGVTGKTVESSVEERGIFQVSVFVPLNDGSYDNLQLQTVDAVLSAFPESGTTSYNGQEVDFLESSVNGGQESDAWFQRDISINYLTFSTRV